MEPYLGNVADFVGESALNDVEDDVRQRLEAIRYKPFRFMHNADSAFARCCYLASRFLKPTVVLETGVAYGVTSAFILRALQKNNCGTLYSVDLPPLGRGGDQFVGAAIPEYLKSRWHLHRGISTRVLPKLLREIGPVNVFVHDSLHTYRNMRWEFRMILPYVRIGGMIIADDIEGNRAFGELQPDMRFWSSIKKEGKQSLFGVAIR